MKTILESREYSDYITKQKEKTTDPARIEKWLGEEWQIKLDGFKSIFEQYVDTFDKDGKSVTLDQSKIDAARTTLNAEAAAIAYQGQRKAEYPPIEDQLDTIYHSGVAGWKTKIKAIKDKYPKP